MQEYNLKELFSNIVEKFAKKTAIIDLNNIKYSFIEIDELSEKVSNFLLKETLDNRLIAIDSNKSINSIIAFLACLKSGRTYFFIDLNQPYKRIKKIIDKTKATLLISDKKKLLNLKTLSVNKILNFNTKKFVHNFKNDKPAYVMFTSGSTGNPKGAIISHQSVINFIKWSKLNFKIKNNDVFSQLNPLYFDNSIFDLYCSLFNGCTLVLTEGLDINNPEKLLKRLKKNYCSVWFSTPSLLIYYINIGLIKKEYFKFFKKIIFGGEGFPKKKLRYLIKKIGTEKLFFNVYGPTECTCICSSHIVKNSDFNKKNNFYISIGKIADIFRYKIVDEKIKIIKKENKIGELVLYGPNVSYGYLNDPENTKKNFLLKNSKKIGRGYKTGDLVLKKDDHLYFIGRKDSQIKHMGYRIELNELELLINKLTYVKEACVFYLKKIDKDYGKIVLVVSTLKKISKNNILIYIKQNLPSYFIPAEIIFCDTLKKNANGKIDRANIKKFYEKRISH